MTWEEIKVENFILKIVIRSAYLQLPEYKHHEYM